MVRGVQNKWKHVEFQRGIVNLFWFIPLSPWDEWILKVANWPIELRDCFGGPILTYFFAPEPMTAPKQSHCPIQHNTGPVLRLTCAHASKCFWHVYLTLLFISFMFRLSVKRSSLKDKISISQSEAKAEAILRKHPELAFLIKVMQLSLVSNCISLSKRVSYAASMSVVHHLHPCPTCMRVVQTWSYQ